MPFSFTFDSCSNALAFIRFKQCIYRRFFSLRSVYMSVVCNTVVGKNAPNGDSPSACLGLLCNATFSRSVLLARTSTDACVFPTALRRRERTLSWSFRRVFNGGSLVSRFSTISTLLRPAPTFPSTTLLPTLTSKPTAPSWATGKKLEPSKPEPDASPGTDSRRRLKRKGKIGSDQWTVL